ncbi:MAG: hypothetical protein GXO36_04725 [Chloroflexi bacterium]|nr:hypothetical protein [Chloroflexota bacterium]
MRVVRHPGALWFILALIPRLLAALVGRNMGIGLDDMFQYDMLARSLAAGKGFRWYAIEDVQLIQRYLDFDPKTHPQYDPQGLRTSFRAPVYPAFLAVVYRLAGFEHRFFAARVAQAFVTATVAPLTWWVARRLIPQRPRAAHAAAAVVSLYPMLVLLPLALATENLFLPLSLALFAWTLRGPDETRPIVWAGLAGVLMVLVLLTRSVSAVFLPIVAWRAWRSPHRGRTVAVFLAVVVAGVLPWLLRNRALHGRWVWIETSGGYNLYIGFHPQGDGTFYPPAAQELLFIVDDAERDAYARQQAWAFVRAHPLEAGKRILRRLQAFYGLERRVVMFLYSQGLFGAWSRPALLIAALIWLAPFVGLMLLAVRTWPHGHRGPGWGWWLAWVVAYTLPHALILADPRMHLALVPLLTVAAMWTVFMADQWRAAEARARWKAWAGRAAQLGLVLAWGLDLAGDWDRIVVLFGPEGYKAHFDY